MKSLVTTNNIPSSIHGNKDQLDGSFANKAITARDFKGINSAM